MTLQQNLLLPAKTDALFFFLKDGVTPDYFAAALQTLRPNDEERVIEAILQSAKTELPSCLLVFNNYQDQDTIISVGTETFLTRTNHEDGSRVSDKLAGLHTTAFSLLLKPREGEIPFQMVCFSAQPISVAEVQKLTQGFLQVEGLSSQNPAPPISR